MLPKGAPPQLPEHYRVAREPGDVTHTMPYAVRLAPLPPAGQQRPAWGFVRFVNSPKSEQDLARAVRSMVGAAHPSAGILLADVGDCAACGCKGFIHLDRGCCASCQRNGIITEHLLIDPQAPERYPAAQIVGPGYVLRTFAEFAKARHSYHQKRHAERLPSLADRPKINREGVVHHMRSADRAAVAAVEIITNSGGKAKAALPKLDEIRRELRAAHARYTGKRN